MSDAMPENEVQAAWTLIMDNLAEHNRREEFEVVADAVKTIRDAVLKRSDLFSEMREALESARKQLETYAAPNEYPCDILNDESKAYVKNDAWKECEHIDTLLAKTAQDKGGAV